MQEQPGNTPNRPTSAGSPRRGAQPSGAPRKTPAGAAPAPGQPGSTHKSAQPGMTGDAPHAPHEPVQPASPTYTSADPASRDRTTPADRLGKRTIDKPVKREEERFARESFGLRRMQPWQIWGLGIAIAVMVVLIVIAFM
jgi:hypothetical protein